MLLYLTLVLLGISSQLTLANIEENLQNLGIAGIGDLPNNITSKIPSKEDMEMAFAEKCKKHGGQEAYERGKLAKQEVIECIQGLVDYNKLQEEMEKAKPTGDLDSVFKKYCRKSPEFKSCITNFTTAFEPCLDEEEKGSVATVLNVTQQLAEFICHKEGVRIALFIAEGGPECLNSSSEAIRDCVQMVFKKNFPNPDDINTGEIPLLLFKAEQCENFFKLQTCVVEQLEKCKEPTPANIVDSLFNFIKKVTPCSSYKPVKQVSDSSTNSHSPSIFSFLTTIYIIFFNLTLLRLFGNH